MDTDEGNDGSGINGFSNVNTGIVELVDMRKVTTIVIVIGFSFILACLYLYVVAYNNVLFVKNSSLKFVLSKCITNIGYICTNQNYSHSNGNLSLLVGQSVTPQWNSAKIYFVSAAQESGVVKNGLNDTIPHATINNILNEWYAINVNIPISGPVKSGTEISGYVWATYTLSAYPNVFTTQIATISAKAT